MHRGFLFRIGPLVPASRVAFPLVTLLFLALGPGCFHERKLAQAPYPERLGPQVDEDPPPPGEGEGLRLIDSTVGPTRVEIHEKQVSGSAKEGSSGVKLNVMQEGYRLLCETPCAVNLPQGAHDIRLLGAPSSPLLGPGQRWHQIVEVGKRPTVVRVTPTERTERSSDTLPMWLYSIGLAGVATGVYVAADTKPGEDITSQQERKKWGRGIALGSLAFLGLTVVFDFATAPTVRPGASTTFKMNSLPTATPEAMR